MEPIVYDITDPVQENIDKQSVGLKAKIKSYLDVLVIKGHSILLPYSDKIEGYKNLFELRPDFGNIEFRMIYFWIGNHAWFINSFYERGKAKENRREYERGHLIRNIMLERR